MEPDPDLYEEELEDIEDLSAIFKDPSPTWKKYLPYFGTGLVLVAAVWLLWGGGTELFMGTGTADSLAVAESSADGAIIDSASLEMQAEKTEQPQKEQEEAVEESEFQHIEQIAKIDSSEIDSLLGVTMDEFFMLLNAQVSEEETALLDDESFYLTLFESMEPSPGVPAPPRSTSRQSFYPGQKADEPVTIDTSVYFARIDSLSRGWNLSRIELSQADDNIRRLQGQLNRLASVSDSLHAAELKKLAKIIGSMDPLDAAIMLQDRTSDELTSILFKLKPRQAAKILEELPTDMSADVATKIIKR